MDWPFGDVAYADMIQIVDRFDTNNQGDLVSAYDALIGKETCDPFGGSAAAVDAFDDEFASAESTWQSINRYFDYLNGIEKIGHGEWDADLTEL